MNGVELATRIRQDHPNCKILFLSGSVTIIDLLAEIQAAGHDFILVDKPVHPAVLIDAIKEALQDAESLARTDPSPLLPEASPSSNSAWTD